MPEELKPYKTIILVSILSIIFLYNVYYFIFSGWGLITIHVHEVPVDVVVKSIERQGWVKILSNVDPTTTITMDVDHVPVCEALETLANTARAQWKLTWFAGPSHSDVLAGMTLFTSGGDFRSSGWHRYGSPTNTGILMGEDDPVPDPTGQTWNVTDKKTDLKGYLEATVAAADVQVYAPDSWNPTMASSGVDASYSINSGVSGLIRQAHGTFEVLYTLSGMRRRGPGGDGPQQRPPDGGGGGDWGSRNDPSLLWGRLENLTKGLPSDARTAALSRIQAEKSFIDSIQNLPDDQKRQKMMEHMVDNSSGRGMRNSPEGRQSMYQRIIATKAATMGTGPSSTGGGSRGSGLTSSSSPTK